MHRSSLCCNSTKNSNYSLVGISGIHARPDIGYEIPTPNRPRVLQLILKKWASLTLLAWRFGFSRLLYRPLFELMWGKDSLDIKFPPDTEEICETPGGAAVFGGDPEPIKLGPEERTEADTVYDHWGASIDAYEQSVQVSTFTSKFDASLKGNYTMTPDEMAGFNLFNVKGNCNSCHVDGRGTTLTPGE